MKSPTPGLAVLLTCLVALGPLSTDFYLPALPEIARALGAGGECCLTPRAPRNMASGETRRPNQFASKKRTVRREAYAEIGATDSRTPAKQITNQKFVGFFP